MNLHLAAQINCHDFVIEILIRMKKLDLENYERKELIVLLKETIEKLEKQKTQLQTTQARLRFIRDRFIKTKAIVKYQGERITQLYESKGNVNLS